MTVPAATNTLTPAGAISPNGTAPLHPRSASGGAAASLTPFLRPAFQLLDDDEIDQLPDPQYRIDGLVPLGGFTVLFGRSGVGKSFLSLDWGSCVAAGEDWQGHTVKAGPVVYVAAEGAGGKSKRRRAWKIKHDLQQAPNFCRVRETVPLLQPEMVGQFIRRARGRLHGATPAMVIFDTLAAAMVGGDESATRNMTQACASLKNIQAELGGCDLLVVHHTGKDGDDERGSYVLRCTADASLKLEQDGGGITLEGHKQRDWSPGEPIYLHLEPVSLPGGQPSCVLVSGAAPAGKLTDNAREALRTLWNDFLADEGATQTHWEKASRLPDETFNRARKVLVRDGFVTDTKGKRGARCSVTDAGRAALGV